MQSPWAVLAAAVIVVGGLAGTAPPAAAQAGANQQQKWAKPGKAAAPQRARRQQAQQRAVRGGPSKAVRNRNATVNRNVRVNRNVTVNRNVRASNNRVVVNARRGGPPAWRYGHRYRGSYYNGRRWYRGGYYGGRYWGPGYYDYGWGGFAAGAIVGVAAGAAVAAAAAPTVVYDEPVYATGPGGRVIASGGSGVVASGVPGAGGYAPFTPGWYEYCESKYRSFEPDTGLYTGYDGNQHYCQ